MIKKFITYVQTLGLNYEVSYQNKKELIAFNSLFFWTSFLIFLNIIVSYLQNLHYFALVNSIATVLFTFLLFLNKKGFFKIIKHVGIIVANMYVYVLSLVGGPELQFQYAYCIILTMIGFVFIPRKYLLIHLPISILFFVATKVSYYYIAPIQFIPAEQRDFYAFNNGITFLILISANAIVFRNQTNVFLDEIETKKSLIEEKQKEIFDSINYAKRIQSAILAHSDLLNEHLKKENHFILFQPKDIVSGDFYWATTAYSKYKIDEAGFTVNKFDELFYLALCDSTGHGVPGAFMSLLNMGFLSEAIKEKNIYEPHKIFDFVRKRLIESISKEDQKDGFDGILICINKTTNQITYAAANNNPVVVSGTEMIHLPADKMPVGKGEKTDSFKLYNIDYKHKDLLYLYTDGFPDQFGGPKGKKFKYKQLEELILKVSSSTLDTQHHILNTTFETWKGELEQVDDVCLVGIKL